MQNKKKSYSAEEKQAYYMGYGAAFGNNVVDLFDGKSNSYIDSFMNGFNKASDVLLLKKGKKATKRKVVKKIKGR